MFLKRLIQILLFVGLFNPIYMYAQEYYYSDGQKIYISHQTGRYVIHFDKEMEYADKEYILDQNYFKFDKEKLTSEYVIIESMKSEKDLKNIVDSHLVKSITKLFTLSNKFYDFTITNKIIVMIRNDVSEDQIFSLISEFNPEKIGKKWLGERVILFSLSTTDELKTLEIANFIYESGLVEFSHPDFVTFNWPETNDTHYVNQWNLSKIGASNAWNITTGSSSIKIAILDAGVESDHPDLGDDLVTGYDVVDDDNTTDPYNDYYHGTACAGIASAETNNNTGIAGVGYNCKIMPIQFTHTTNWGNSSNFAAGINWAWNNGAHVISISGNTLTADVVNNAINSATSKGRNNKGCVVIKSAGNRGEIDGNITFPGQHPKVIAVGATDQNDSRRSYSSYGSALDVMAPSHVYATDLTGSSGGSSGDYISSFTGTSAAAPHVAGLAGLVLSLDNSLTEQEVREIICYTSDDKGSPGWDQYYGWGRINAYSAVKCANGNFTTSGTLQYSEYWRGTVNITGNLIVPTGKYLHISDNTTVNLNGYYIYCSGTGRIYHNGTVNGYKHYSTYTSSYYTGFYPSSVSVQQIIDWASSGWDIFVASGTYTENISMKAGVDVKGSDQSSTTINGNVYFNNDNGAGISNCTINGKIDLDYSDGVSIDNVKQVYQGSVGVDHYNSSSDINEFESTSRNYHGIYVHTFSDSYIEDSNVRNKSKGLFIVSSSDADAAYTVFCQNATDVIAGSGACYLHNCSFSSSTPGSSVSGNVTWNTWTFCGRSKSCSYTSEPYMHEKYAAVHQGDQIDPAEKDYFNAKDLWKEVRKAIKQEKKSGKGYDIVRYAPEIRETAGKFKDVVSKYPTSIYAGCSLGYIARAHRILGEYTKLSEYVINLTTDKKYQDIKPQALSILIPSSIDQGQYKDAISRSDQIIDTFPDSPLVCELIYGKGLIFKNYLKDINKAVEMFREVIERFPDHPTALSARTQLEAVEHEPVSQKPVKTEKEDKPFNVSAHSYPNPFNPETRINFILPEQGRVIVNIYDIMGKQIRTLVNEERAAGRHEVLWDGKNSAGSPAASGMYFYQIKFKDKIITKKMMLVR